MKKILLILLTVNCFSQAPVIQWQKCLGGTRSDYSYMTRHTSDGGYITAGYTFSNDGDVVGMHSNVEDLWVVKLDGSGNIQWKKCYGGYGDDEALSIIETSDGGYIMSGYAKSNSGDVSGNHNTDGSSDYWVVKINQTGNIEWKKCYGGSGNDTSTDVKQTTDGGYIVIGYSNSNDFDVSGNHGGDDIWVVKLTSTGTIQWQKSYGGSNFDISESIEQTSDGGYVFIGSAMSNDYDVSDSPNGNLSFSAWIVKINNLGIIEWQKILGTIGGFGTRVKQTLDNGYIVLRKNGNATGNHGGSEIGLIKLDSIGTIQWEKSLGGSQHESPGGLIQLMDGNYVVSGSTNSNNGNVSGNHGDFDAWVVKLNPSGTILWQKTYGGSSSDGSTFIEHTSDNGYIFGGYTSSSGIANGDVSGYHGTSGADYWVVKLAPENLSTEAFDNTKITFYPNPTSNLLNVQFSNENPLDKIIIKDITGKTILEESKNTTQVNTESLTPGIYLIEVFSGENKYQTKFIKE